MRHIRLRLVAPKYTAEAATDGANEVPAVPANPESGMRRLRLVDTEEGAPPDDAA